MRGFELLDHIPFVGDDLGDVRQLAGCGQNCSIAPSRLGAIIGQISFMRPRARSSRPNCPRRASNPLRNPDSFMTARPRLASPMLGDNGSFTLNGAADDAPRGGPRRAPGRRARAILWSETKTRILPTAGGPAGPAPQRTLAERNRRDLACGAREARSAVMCPRPGAVSGLRLPPSSPW